MALAMRRNFELSACVSVRWGVIAGARKIIFGLSGLAGFFLGSGLTVLSHPALRSKVLQLQTERPAYLDRQIHRRLPLRNVPNLAEKAAFAKRHHYCSAHHQINSMSITSCALSQCSHLPHRRAKMPANPFLAHPYAL
ncbi:hypothetical protein [Sphingobium sp. WCS2017Hpa-17]|uniref:hypothetical protein n=1 Tax=Sphingobium sp. WCS2017Hpa-17 TaxID=3073638 RepID=UPI0028896327|nr:hypothetical protein [Sphingobium sp. WCS2017Hpa-17]